MAIKMINTDIYKKDFTKLSEGVEEIRKYISEKDQSLNDIDFSGCNSFLDEYKTLSSRCMEKVFDGNFPDIMDEDFPNVYGIGIFGNKFYFRTKGIFSFSFDIDTRNISNGTDFVISMYIYIRKPRNPMAAIAYNKIVDGMKEAGWEYYDAPGKNDYKKKNYNKNNKLQNTVKKNNSEVGVSDEEITNVLNKMTPEQRNQFFEGGHEAIDIS